MDDAGLYMCQINTDPMRAQSAWLRVKIPPDIDMERTSGEHDIAVDDDHDTVVEDNNDNDDDYQVTSPAESTRTRRD